MAGRPPKPRLVRKNEGDQSKGASRVSAPVKHLSAPPEKPSYLSKEASEIWDQYLAYSAPGLLKLVHAPGLAQLCEDRALELRLRRALAHQEEQFLAKMAEPDESGKKAEPHAEDPLLSITQDGSLSGLFRVLSSTITRINRQEQQFGLTPASATKVDIGEGPGVEDDIEKALCG